MPFMINIFMHYNTLGKHIENLYLQDDSFVVTPGLGSYRFLPKVNPHGFLKDHPHGSIDWYNSI